MKKVKNIAIIPARIGSKRIKEKNIKKFFGKPIIYWTIEKLYESKIFDKIYVSTDSTKIINILKKFKFCEIILRGPSLSNDSIGTDQVIKHAMKKIDIQDKHLNICCVYPCNPFLNIPELKKAFSRLKKDKNSFVFPIVEYSHPIERAFEYISKFTIKRISKEKKKEKTQDYKKKYYDAGKYYLASKNTWSKTFRKKNGIVTKWWNGIDIDEKGDWNKAELIFQMMKLRSNKITKNKR